MKEKKASRSAVSGKKIKMKVKKTSKDKEVFFTLTSLNKLSKALMLLYLFTNPSSNM
jgi:hypothetical protein